ncbi:zinc-ribbon domain-containing protein [Paraburkholderia sp. RL18-103-BIB-C]|jgi:DNA-directed RNA polymerase subunit RPC12/RpoP
MALVKCKQCGNEVSDKAPTCVKCGAPVVKQQTDAGKMGQERWWAA